MAKTEGGCLCGAVRYKSDADPLLAVLCHCTNCQKQSGGAYSVNVITPKASLDIQGEMATYVDMGDSGQPVARNFCGRCGSGISSQPAVMETLTVLKAGSPDDSSRVRPVKEIYCDSARQWTREDLDMEAHPKMMPA